MRKKLIKVSDEEYEALKLARESLVFLGANNLPESLKKIVQNALKQDVDQLTLGVMVHISANALIFMLADKRD